MHMCMFARGMGVDAGTLPPEGGTTNDGPNEGEKSAHVQVCKGSGRAGSPSNSQQVTLP